jgi:hypothetical protein
MASKKNNGDTEAVRLYITETMNKEQQEHSKLLLQLEAALGGTREYDEAVKVLTKIYDAKSRLLTRIFNDIRGL